MKIGLGLTRLNWGKFAHFLSTLNNLVNLRASVGYSILLAHRRLVAIIVSRICSETSRLGSLGYLGLERSDFTGLRLLRGTERMGNCRVGMRRKRYMRGLSVLSPLNLKQALIPHI